MTTVLKDGEVDKLVMEWLKKRNFTESLKVLELELQANGDKDVTATAAQVWADKSGGSLVEGVLLGTAGGGDPTSYAAEFVQLANWVDGSLDIYRPGLYRLLYPVFAHTYLQMVGLGAAAEAQALLAEHKQCFLNAASNPRSLRVRERELHELQSIATPEQLGGSNLVRGIRAARTPARIAQPCYDLLTRFLQNENLLLMLGVVNQRVALEVVDLPLVGAAQPEEEAPLASGIGERADADTINQTQLDLKMLQSSIEQRYGEAAAEVAEQEAMARAEDEKLPKRDRAKRQKEAAQAKTRRETLGAACMASQIPLPAVPEEREAALLLEMKEREKAGGPGMQPLSAQALPDAAFFTFVNSGQSLNCVSLSSDAALVAGGFADSSVRVYDLRSAPQPGPSTMEIDGRQTDGRPTHLSGHTAPVFATDFSPDEQLLLSCSGDGSIRLWSMELQVGLAAYRGHMLPVWDVAFAPHYGFYFASAGADRTARIWNTERSQALRVFVGHQADVDVVRWHPNCHYVATGSSDCTVRLWDLRSGGCARILTGHSSSITSLAFSPDNTTLSSADADGVLTAWDLASAKPLATHAAHSGPVWSLAYSNGEGSLLASGGADCTVRLWAAKEAVSGIAQQQDGVAATGTEPALYRSVALWHTKATPVAGLRFTTRNLLLGAGALALRRT